VQIFILEELIMLKKRIKTVLVAIIGIIAISILLGCASGPNFGKPTPIQEILNEVAGRFPINIAGNQVRLSFEGDFWRGQVNGKDTLAGDCKIVENADGAIITLNQSWAYVNNKKKVPLTGEPVASWQKTPGPNIILEYKKGPPATLGKPGENE
jgi:membrane protein implicated in regulation of membrane protease activity